MSKNAQLIYLMDPQCGWCFGFSKTAQAIAAYYLDSDLVEPVLVTGGLFHPALTIGPEFAEDKRPIASKVSQHFDVTFSEDYFTNVLGPGQLDSYPACLLINAVKAISPASDFEVAGNLISAAFKTGRNISDTSICLDVAQESGFERDQIASLMASPDVQAMTAQSFEFAKQMGTGFPSLFLKTASGLSHLGGTQLTQEQVIDRVDSALGVR